MHFNMIYFVPLNPCRFLAFRQFLSQLSLACFWLFWWQFLAPYDVPRQVLVFDKAAGVWSPATLLLVPAISHLFSLSLFYRVKSCSAYAESTPCFAHTISPFLFFFSNSSILFARKQDQNYSFQRRGMSKFRIAYFSGASLDNNSLLFTTLICDFLFLLSICPKLNICGAGILFYILDVCHWQKTELLGYWHSMGAVMPVMIKSLQNNHWNGITQPPCYSEKEKVLLDLFKHLG